MIGKKLGGRYEILERIGGGGMALVYMGLDILLHRKVAVKVLRQQYVHDEEFIRRFRREAQAAASLSHPNVVSIYDVGQEGEIHYIVMEYIEGTTLNDLIKERAPLQVEEAVRYASQICDALDHAHHNEIIHRDIKPHNILIGKNGRVKVTDFGIARAATSSTITQTGSVVGSVHYFSPEHAKGTSTGEKSDLYSLGIVLYQMLTARLPFLGESPISVALKHLQEEVEEPRKVNPLIPQSVENIILKALRKKPEERYQSAREMLQDLETCLLPERRNEAKIHFWNDDEIDDESTRVIPAIRPNQFTEKHEPEEKIESRDDQTAAKKKGWIKPVVWIGVLLIILAGMWYMVGWVKAKWTIPDVPVPNVVGKPVAQAIADLEKAHLGYSIVNDTSSTVPKDSVISQDPPSDQKTKINNKVTLHVSTGPEKQKMPSLVNQNVKDATARLVALGFVQDKIVVEQVFSDTVAADTVINQTPGVDEPVDPTNATVKLTVSKGKETFKMPNLVGMTLNDAKKVINDNRLKLSQDDISYEASYQQPKDKVIKQFPYNANDDVSPGAAIKLIVSKGLPDEAGQMIVTVPLKPSVDGKASTFKLIVSDATNDNFEYATKTVSKPDSIDVRLVMAPGQKATIQVKENDQLQNIITKTYQDYLDQKSGKTGTGTTPSPNSGSGSGTTKGSGTNGGSAGTTSGTGGAGSANASASTTAMGGGN
jgi:serine/threonine-protein kinase